MKAAPNRGRLRLVAGVMIAAAAFVLGCASVTERDWKLIKSYEGTIDPADGVLRVKVYSAEVVKDGTFDSMAYFQNRIEVQSPAGDVRRFMWPKPFAGRSCDVIDLNGDGIKEFLIRTETAARVVSYRNGQFQYRDQIGPDRDDTTSLGPLETLDIDGDGKMEFVEFWPRFYVTGKEERLPSVKQWTKERGFQPAPASLLEAYKKKQPTGR